VGPSDAAQRFPDRRMLGVERMAGDRAPPAPRRQLRARADARPRVVGLGVVDNLAGARSQVGALPPGVAIYTRLNVWRAHREAEHADLAAGHPTPNSVAA
jgi:hypothetical protein